MQISPAFNRGFHRLHLLIQFLLLILLLYIPADLWALGHPYVVKEINTSGNAIDPYSTNPFAVLGNSIIFAASDGSNGTELWKSDGTSNGTVLVKDINPGAGSSSPNSLTTFAGKIVFRALDPINGTELWVTDGTTEGTQLLADIYPGATSSNPQKFTIVGNTLYLVATTAAGSKLWKTDGTPSGTMPATEFNPGYFSTITSVTATAGKLLVVTYLSGMTQTWDLWAVDPVAGTTTRITTFFSQPANFTLCNDRVFFSVNGDDLWMSDGTNSGTVLVKDMNTGPHQPNGLTCLGSTLYFSAGDVTTGRELWKSDGTDAGTVLVMDIYPGGNGSGPNNITAFNGKLLFAATGPGTGTELWSSDGTDSGTFLVKEINPGGSSSSSPGNFSVAGNLTFFTANDGSHGEEIWITDGSTENTFLLSDLNPGSAHATPRNFAKIGSTLFFSAYDSSSRYKLMAASVTPAPYSRISSPLNGSFSKELILSITGEAHSDTGSPVALVEVSTDNGASWSQASGSTNWGSIWPPLADGMYTLLSRATDLTGAVEIPGQGVRVTIDRTPPGGFMIINNNSPSTTSPLVALEITASANDPDLTCNYITTPYICGTVSIRFSNDGANWSGWAAVQTTKSWPLSSGDGEKIVYAQLKDQAGNTTDISKTIILDTSLVPSSTITTPANGFATNASSLLVTGTAAPGPGGGIVTQVEVSKDGGSTWVTATGTANWNISLSLPSVGTYSIKSRARTSTMVETPATGITVTIERTPPTGTLALYYGIWTLNASANDGGICILVYPFICGALDMSSNGISWQPATTNPGTGGPLWIRDKAGNTAYIPFGSYTNPNGGPINMSSSTSVYYSLLQQAYDAAQNGDLIKLSNGLTENLTFSRSTSLTVRGGYSSGFVSATGTTPITGNLTVQAGSNAIENIDLNGTVTIQGGDISVSNTSIN